MQRKYGCPDGSAFSECEQLIVLTSQRLEEYNECVKDCGSHMLTGSWCGQGESVIPADALRAVSIVQQLGFVGLTEQWPLSVCLFHAKFGGMCYRSSFVNVRPGAETQKYDE